MNEPIYNYVKGQGWVTNAYHFCTLSDGTVIRILQRVPEEGERRFILQRRHDPGWFQNNEVDLVRIKDYLSMFSWNSLKVYPSRRDLEYLNDPDVVWFVLEKV